MSDEKSTEVMEEQEYAEFDAAFEEAASQVEDAPGEVGGDEPEDLEQDAADAASAEESLEGEEDLAGKLAALEEEAERLRQSERSQRGRVSALTKKLLEQRAAHVPPAARQDDVDAAHGEDWDEFKEDFPEMAAIIERNQARLDSRMNELNSLIEQLQATQDALIEKEAAVYRTTQLEILGERHPDFEEIKASKEFAEFKASAPANVQAMIASTHAEDAIIVLDAFKQSTGWKPGGEKDTGKSEVERINERRAENLKKSAGISSKKVGRAVRQDMESDDDFDSAFAAAAREKEKRRANRI